MAQELNTVSAPTEGLGQTVTFQFNPQQVPQLQLPTCLLYTSDAADE